MRTFAALAAARASSGFAIGTLTPDEVALGGWVGGAVLSALAFGLSVAYKKDSPGQSA